LCSVPRKTSRPTGHLELHTPWSGQFTWTRPQLSTSARLCFLPRAYHSLSGDRMWGYPYSSGFKDDRDTSCQRHRARNEGWGSCDACSFTSGTAPWEYPAHPVFATNEPVLESRHSAAVPYELFFQKPRRMTCYFGGTSAWVLCV
jgi:hypothetical protein